MSEADSLTRQEKLVWDILELFRGNLVESDFLASEVFGVADKSSRTSIRVYIYRIRKKIPEANIRVIWGRGYILADAQ